MKTFVIGDIHGAHKALLQCLERSNFDYQKDTLICLGDVADGWPDVYQCFEELFKIFHLVYIRGNHDQWLKDWLKYGKNPDIWTMQGGQSSLHSYLKNGVSVEDMQRHMRFLDKTPFYHVDEKDRCFVHAGVSQQGIPIEETDKMFLCWDRELWENRNNLEKVEPFSEIYVGHTSIFRFSRKPLNYGNVWFMDTGAGWDGVLSMMDIDSKEVFQSDIVQDLYPGIKGR